MLKNYFKIAWRSILKNKTFSLINIFGLAVGIATCLIIMLYIFNEYSYDRYNEKADRIVRVVFRGNVGGGEIKEANVMPPVASAMLHDFPEVQQATRIMTAEKPFIKVGDNTFSDDEMAYADTSFFSVFSIPMLKGNKKTALAEPMSIVISDETAVKYFGNSNPIGRTLDFKTWGASYRVTGVFRKMPENSHFHFDMLASMAEVPDAKSDKWMISGFFTYLVLPEGYDYKKLEAKMPQLINKYMGPQIKQAFGMDYTQFRQKGNRVGLFLEPLTDIHLKSDMNGDIGPHGNIRYVYIFGATAIFMLLIACINFMNLSTASSSQRAKEVGMRKVLGSIRIELIKQFLTESILLTVIALLLAIGFVYLALPLFNRIAETALDLNLTAKLWVIPGLLLSGLLLGTLAGSYPAFVLSGFKPIAVLKRKLSSGSPVLRSGLVIFQFFISITLIISTIILYRQLSYIQNKKLGYNKDQLLILQNTWILNQGGQAVLKDALLRDPRVLSVSTSTFLPADNHNLNNYTVYPDDKVGQYVQTPIYRIDDSYIPTMGMELAEGRNFSKSFASDSLGVIINESAARAFGWSKAAVGNILTGSINNKNDKITYHVIGVVKDFHFKNFRESISPMMMVWGEFQGNMIVKTRTTDAAGLLTMIKNNWPSDEPPVYTFMDERFNRMFKTDLKTSTILSIFSGLTIFVACLGLFGLASFTAQQRIKEIGVRKVLGATVADITALLAKDFIRLVLIAIVIACPVAWYFMNKWLQDFAYRIEIQWWMFAAGGILAVLIAFVTISSRSIKAALMNPVNSLRSE